MSSQLKPKKIQSLRPYDWNDILVASQAEGQRMVERLLSDFNAETNRFAKQGEILLIHLQGTSVVAVAGLNQESETCFGKAGRVRRLYVLPSCRAKGLARSLLEEITSFAHHHYEALTVNVGNVEARCFYERLGFKPVAHPRITHIKRLVEPARVTSPPG